LTAAALQADLEGGVAVASTVFFWMTVQGPNLDDRQRDGVAVLVGP
jgi:hypothetical protein